MNMKQILEVRGSIPEIIRNEARFYEGNLVGYFRTVFHHAKNLSNPYHNFRHICHVMWLCYQACLYYSSTLSKRDMRNLLIASLFHDFDHTGKAGPDAVNIEKAIAGFKTHILPEDEPHFGGIAELIRVTQYPYIIPSENVDLLGQIIRDADLSQALNVAWIQQVIFGLAAEWGKNPLEVLRMQDRFHSNLKFYTTWAQEMFPKSVIETKSAEARELLDLLVHEPVSAA